MNTKIKIRGYDSKTVRTTIYEIPLRHMTSVTGREDHFEDAERHAQTLMALLRCLYPRSTFSIEAIDLSSHDPEARIDGKSDWEIAEAHRATSLDGAAA